MQRHGAAEHTLYRELLLQRRLVQTRGRLEPTTPDAVQPRRTASGHAGHRPTSPAGGRPRPARPATGRPPARQSDQAGLRPTYKFQNVKTPKFKLAALSGRFWDTSFFGSMVHQRPATGHLVRTSPATAGQAGQRPARPDGVRPVRTDSGHAGRRPDQSGQAGRKPAPASKG